MGLKYCISSVDVPHQFGFMDENQRSRVAPLTRVEEHVANRGRLLMDLEGVATQDYPFGDYPCGVCVEERAICHEMWS